jgi:hypothetical protein
MVELKVGVPLDGLKVIVTSEGWPLAVRPTLWL